MPIDMTSADWRLFAKRVAVITGNTIRAPIRRMPDDPHRERDRQPDERGERHVEHLNRDPADPCPLLVDRDRDEAAVQSEDRDQRGEPQRRDEREVASRNREDRAEEEREQVGVELLGGGDEDDSERNPAVEEECERLVPGRAVSAPQPFDPDRAGDRGD